MLDKTITKENFRRMIEALMEENEVIGPKWRDRTAEGKKVFRFSKLNEFEELQMDYTRSASSPRNFFLPYKETLATYNLVETEWDQQIQYTVHPRVIVGIRACDINAHASLTRSW
ncbi:MAG: hypothetical protein E4G99_05965 [Anaerolineales bacterium]|nr:MAG: hypothetical protein E4G99_05965 [Anaerolineales bacterium]